MGSSLAFPFPQRLRSESSVQFQLAQAPNTWPPGGQAMAMPPRPERDFRLSDVASRRPPSPKGGYASRQGRYAWPAPPPATPPDCRCLLADGTPIPAKFYRVKKQGSRYQRRKSWLRK